MKNFIKKERKARAKRRFERAQTLIKRDWSKINDFPVWILTPSGVAPNLASQSTALDMNQGTPSYPSLQNQAHQCFVTKDEADRANRPEIEERIKIGCAGSRAFRAESCCCKSSS